MQDFCKNCSKFNQSLGFINTGSVNNWSNWLDGATLSVDNIEKTFGLWETKPFNGTPTIDFGDSKYNFKGWVSKENIYNKTGVTVGGSALVGGGDGSYVLEAGAGGWNGITNGVNKVTQSPDLWGNLSGYIHDAGQHLFSGDNSIWHGATSNEQEWVQIEFPVEKKISMFRGWYGTYMNPNDRPHTIRLYGSNNNSNYDLLVSLTGLNWSLNGANDYVNMVNYQEFIIPESNQGYYKYYCLLYTSPSPPDVEASGMPCCA